MGIVSALYAHQYGKDAASTQLDLVYAAKNTSGADSGLTVEMYTVPTDRILELRSLSARLVPGALQTVAYAQAYFVVNGKSYFIAYLGSSSGVAAAGVGALNWFGCIYLPPGAVISINGEFNDGTNSNELHGNVFGENFPRGNIQI
jgi:hypothetical protein